jgi:hypothetical protein
MSNDERRALLDSALSSIDSPRESEMRDLLHTAATAYRTKFMLPADWIIKAHKALGLQELSEEGAKQYVEKYERAIVPAEVITLLEQYRDGRQRLIDSPYDDYTETKPEAQRQLALLNVALAALSASQPPASTESVGARKPGERNEGNWTYPYEFLEAIERAIPPDDFAPALEGIELALLGYEKVTGTLAQRPPQTMSAQMREALKDAERYRYFRSRWENIYWQHDAPQVESEKDCNWGDEEIGAALDRAIDAALLDSLATNREVKS